MRHIIVLIKVALGNLLLQKMRTFLTILGTAIGIAAVITTFGASEGTRKQVNREIGAMGLDTLYIYVLPPSGNLGEMRFIPLEQSDGALIKEMCPSVKETVSVVSSSRPVRTGSKTLMLGVRGVTANYRKARNYDAEIGRFFDEEEDRSYALVCALGRDARAKLFGKKNPIGSKITIGSGPEKVTVQVIGVMEEKSGMEGWRDDQIYVPFNTANKLLGIRGSICFLAQAVDQGKIEDAAEEILYFLKPRHPTVVVWNQKQLTEINRSILKKLTLSSMALITICLSMGGIGIMNMMLVAVVERKREIGIRKSLGAKKRDILSQFLTEAMIISTLGGLVGIVLGLFANNLITVVILGLPADIPLPLIARALLFSTCVGLFFGIVPAHKAAQLDPIEALRSL